MVRATGICPGGPGFNPQSGHLFCLNIDMSWQAIDLFIASTDQLYGPIMTVRSEGQVVKKIPWSAFKMSNRDWARVLDVRNILTVCDP